jgi:hypothetical protein
VPMAYTQQTSALLTWGDEETGRSLNEQTITARCLTRLLQTKSSNEMGLEMCCAC